MDNQQRITSFITKKTPEMEDEECKEGKISEQLVKTEEVKEKPTKFLSLKPHNKDSQETTQQKQRAKQPPLNSVSDLQQFLARKKKEREERQKIGHENNKTETPQQKTTLVRKMLPSNIVTLEDESLRHSVKPCAYNSCRAVNSEGDDQV